MKIKFLRTEMDKQPLRHILNTRLQVSIKSAQMLIIEGYYSINIFILKCFLKVHNDFLYKANLILSFGTIL